MVRSLPRNGRRGSLRGLWLSRRAAKGSQGQPVETIGDREMSTVGVAKRINERPSYNARVHQ